MLGGFEHHRVETFYFEVKYYKRSGGKLHITQVQGLDFKESSRNLDLLAVILQCT